MAELPPYPGIPRWVKVFGIIAIILVVGVLFIVLAGIGGPHGPGRHMSSGDARDHTRWGLLIFSASSPLQAWRSTGTGGGFGDRKPPEGGH